MTSAPSDRIKVLESILNNLRNVQPIHNTKALELYKADQDNLDIAHLEFLEFLQYMFGPSAGKFIASTFWRRIA